MCLQIVVWIVVCMHVQEYIMCANIATGTSHFAITFFHLFLNHIEYALFFPVIQLATVYCHVIDDDVDVRGHL